MEIVVAALAAMTAFLFLSVLGAMRELVLLRGETEALAQLIKSPPPPSFAVQGGEVPDELKRALRDRAPAGEDGTQLVVFVSPHCQPCERLADQVSAALGAESADADRVVFVVWARTESEALYMSETLPGRTVLDVDGSIAIACEIRATPTAFVISNHDLRVMDYTQEGKAEWVLRHLTEAAPARLTATTRHFGPVRDPLAGPVDGRS